MNGGASTGSRGSDAAWRQRNSQGSRRFSPRRATRASCLARRDMPRTSLAERLYRLLLRCYPGELRDEYEREMLQAFRDHLGEDRRIGFRAVFGLWRQVFADSIVRAPGEHLDVLQHDVRYAMRSLRRAPLFAMTAIATLALG